MRYSAFKLELFSNILWMVADPKIFSWIATSVADATAVNPNGIKTF